MSNATLKPDFLAQIIGPIATIFGVILGWFLHYISDNKGKIVINCKYKDLKTNKKQYAYNLVMEIYNTSISPKHLKNIRVEFFKKRKAITTCLPRENTTGEINFRGIFSKPEVGIISIRGYELKQLILCYLIEDNTQINSATKIYLFYQTEKCKTKRILVCKDFSLEKVASYSDGEEFPK